MSLWTQLPDLLVSAAIFGAALTGFFLLGLLDDNDDGHVWGDDPHVIAMLCGMSL
jgi:hypothetical protein